MGEWFCTDTDSLQYCKEHERGRYSFVEIVWLDTVEGDSGYPDKEYTVKSAYIDLTDYNMSEKEIAISGYYDSLDAVYRECKRGKIICLKLEIKSKLSHLLKVIGIRMNSQNIFLSEQFVLLEILTTTRTERLLVMEYRHWEPMSFGIT